MQRKTIRHIAVSILLPASLAIFLSGCFTGVEGTKAITQKDVNKALESNNTIVNDGGMSIYKIDPAGFKDWEIGKIFYVTDDNVKLLFNDMAIDKDTISLKGRYLTYKGYSTDMSIDGKETVNIAFADDRHHKYTYSTNKAIGDIEKSGSSYSVPYLVDMDNVLKLRTMLTGKELYVRTSIWYDAAGNMMKGRKFVKVTIKDVLPGSKYFPYMIKFSDGATQAYLYVSSEQSSIQNRSLSDLFSIANPHDKYPSITDEKWAIIIVGDLALDMTKDECRLSLGAPKTIERIPTYDGLKEYWTYDNGTYLIFEDGLLRKYRK